jgi:hypothetical protein
MRCPVCRAENDRGPACRRCRADLSLLHALDGQRRRVLTTACQCLNRGQGPRAQALAEGADALRRDAESLRLLALCHLLRRDFAQAWRYYRRAAAPD